MSVQQWSDYSHVFGNERLKAVFSHSSFCANSGQDRQHFARITGLDPSKLIIPQQTHSANVSVIGKAGGVKNSDGVFSTNTNLVCSIQVADCLPLFFVHGFKPVVGLVHAGWRGLARGIICNIKNELDQIPCNIFDFNILIGPSIHSCCFEVRDDVIGQIDSKFYRQKDYGSYEVDLQNWAVKQLLEIGGQKEKITIIKECTYCQDGKYHSYRRNGKKAGRMIALIGWG